MVCALNRLHCEFSHNCLAIAVYKPYHSLILYTILVLYKKPFRNIL